MVAYSFQPRFVPALRSGEKGQTIRAKGKKRHARVGDLVQVYTGMRTKHCQRLFESPCIEATPIQIYRKDMGELEKLEIVVGDRLLSFEEMTVLALADGFETLAAFIAFFEPAMPFDGVLIKWRPIVPSITVSQRSGDYMAWITGDPACWDCGESPDKAIAELKRTHPVCRDAVLIYYKIS